MDSPSITKIADVYKTILFCCECVFGNVLGKGKGDPLCSFSYGFSWIGYYNFNHDIL